MSINNGHFSRSVSIIGCGYTPLGDVLKTPEMLGMTERELFAWAAIEAMEDANIEAKDIDAFYFGQVGPNLFANQCASSGGIGEWIGMRGKPSISHDEACSTFNMGLQLAVQAVASGVYDVVLAGTSNAAQSHFPLGYPPHLREKNPDFMFELESLVDDAAYCLPGNNMFSILDGGAVSYAQKYNVSFEDLRKAMNQAAIIARWNAVHNPKATYSKQTYEEEAKSKGFATVEDYFNSPFNPPIAVVQHLFHSTLVCDGGGAVIVCPTDKAKDYTKYPVEIIGMGESSMIGNHVFGTPFEIDRLAFERAYRMANIHDPYTEIDYMSIHDCSAQHYFTTTEAGGYFKPGEGWKAVLEGRIAHDGDKPVNTSGGRLSAGHTLSGPGGVEFTEAVGQMRGINGDRQMPKPPKVCVVQGYGGGWNSNVVVLKRSF